MFSKIFYKLCLIGLYRIPFQYSGIENNLIYIINTSLVFPINKLSIDDLRSPSKSSTKAPIFFKLNISWSLSFIGKLKDSSF